MCSTVLKLLVRDEWRNLPPATSTAHALVRAAAALNAGEPKRARRLLAAMPAGTRDDAAVRSALEMMADAVDRNWFPGGSGAVLTPDDLEVLMAGVTPHAADPQADLLVTMAARFGNALAAWRRLVVGDAVAQDRALLEAATVLERVSAADVPAAFAPVAVAVADLYMRAGVQQMADDLMDIAVAAYTVEQDATGLAACDLVRGDWCAGWQASPETLGEELEPQPPARPPVGPADPAGAEAYWSAAEKGFHAAGSVRGVAVVALRRASRAAESGDPAAAIEILDPAYESVRSTGDGALVQLLSVHRALARIQAGGEVDAAAIGDVAGAWATRDGSTSFARGLLRLCVARSRRWREAEPSRGRAAHLLAEAVATAVGAPVEAAMLGPEQVARYASLNYWRAALVLAMTELEHADRLDLPGTDLSWGAWAVRVAAACRYANGQRDAAALTEVDGYACRLLASLPTDSVVPGAVAMVAAELENVRLETAVFVPLYRAYEALAQGDTVRAEAYRAAALVAARTTTPLHLAVVLGAVRRFADADAPLRAVLARHPEPDIAVNLLLRLHRYDEALRVLAEMDRDGRDELFERPWSRPALYAEALLGAGRPAEALSWALRAVAAVEHHLAGLALDVFRIMASDDPVIAGIYATAVTAYTALVQQDPAAYPTYLASGFELSDRCRGASLGELFRQSPDDDATRAAVRAWQRAGGTLAKTIEEIAERTGRRTGRPSVEAVHRRVRDAERDLDDAETRLTATAPAMFANRRRHPSSPPLAEIQQRLAPGTLLLQYHAFDDELITWAVTRDGAEVARQRVETSALTGHAAAYRRAAADRRSTAAGRHALAEPLAPLLQPFAASLREHRRVVVVPYGPLATLPFHVLPFDGDPLGATHDVSYLPAASAAPRRPGAVPLDGPVLVVGDPAYDQDRRVPRLPGARLEAIEVARLCGTAALIDSTADRDRVLGDLASARLVHLATHGMFRFGAPYRTELVLAGRDSLTVPDLLGADLDVNLVVLSACDSGRGHATAAGDVVGLTRTLLGCGVRELVVSMWPVDDLVTCLMMVAFHEALRAGQGSVAAALGTAASTIRSLTWPAAHDWYERLGGRLDADGLVVRSCRDLGNEPAVPADPTHPFYWAPFIHVGTS